MLTVGHYLSKRVHNPYKIYRVFPIVVGVLINGAERMDTPDIRHAVDTSL